MAGGMAVTPRPFEFQSGNVARKSSYNAGHFPWSKANTPCTHGAPLDTPIMLIKASQGIWCRAYIQARMAHGRSKQVATIKRRYCSQVHKESSWAIREATRVD